MKKETIIFSIISLIIGLAIAGFAPPKDTSNFCIQNTTECVLGFDSWNNYTNVKKVSFTVTRERQTSLSMTACLDYLRENYETRADWGKFNYQCVLDRVNSNLENVSTSKSPTWWNDFTLSGDCRCEYSLI